MASRRLRPEDWAPVQQTRIHTRPIREPRDERVKFPQQSSQRSSRPAPLLIAPKITTTSEATSAAPAPAAPITPTSPSCPRRNSTDQPTEFLAAPEIVDLAVPSTWSRRTGPTHRKNSPSVLSQRNNRWSGTSCGIPDYYLREPTPLPVEQHAVMAFRSEAPRIETPVIDPAMEKFDFGLMGVDPSAMQRRSMPQPKLIDLDTLAGAERVDASAPATPLKQTEIIVPPPQQKTYSLFPSNKDGPQACRNSNPTSSDDSATPSPPGGVSHNSIPMHAAPLASYRLRKESISSSGRSRKDSCNSYRQGLRIVSAGSNQTTRSTISNSLSSSTASPPDYRTRWSDETITSPSAVTGGGRGPRTSFGSLLAAAERESSQYPACFFEYDDDEEGESAPLRMKFAWKRSGGSQLQKQSQKREQMGGQVEEGEGRRRRGLGRRVVRVLLCGGCGS